MILIIIMFFLTNSKRNRQKARFIFDNVIINRAPRLFIRHEFNKSKKSVHYHFKQQKIPQKYILRSHTIYNYLTSNCQSVCTGAVPIATFSYIYHRIDGYTSPVCGYVPQLGLPSRHGCVGMSQNTCQSSYSAISWASILNERLD